MLKADLHIHTNYIQKTETLYSPKELIDYAKEKGFSVLAFSEHENHNKNDPNPLKTYHDFKDYAESKGILLIPAVELLLSGNHILALNFLDDSKKYKSLDNLKEIKENNPNCIIVAPHPLFKRPICLGEKKLRKYIDYIDVIEFSHFYTNNINLNKKAVDIAKEYKKPMIGTSDAHFFQQLNKTYTLIDSKKDILSILNAIKNNKVQIVTKPITNKQLVLLGACGFVPEKLTFIKRILNRIL
jgi:predicted metal-dependent phosphoesterase TrpH